MKRWIAAAITGLLLIVVLWMNRQSSKPLTAAATTPEDCLSQMFAAAEQGNLPAYLDCFTGDQRAQVERELSAHSPAESAQA